MASSSTDAQHLAEPRVTWGAFLIRPGGLVIPLILPKVPNMI